MGTNDEPKVALEQTRQDSTLDLAVGAQNGR